MIGGNTQSPKIVWRTHLVSRFLSIECDPLDQPAAHDPVERRTWCALRIRVGGRTVTRMWDKVLREERSLLYLPAFPIAQWLVENWWTLLNEPSPTPEPPRSSSTHLAWIKRHCFRSAESGLLLPALYLFNDGRGIEVEWQADEPDSLKNMPGEFGDSGVDHLEKGPTEDVLSGFVSEVLRRVEGLNDERVLQLRENWQAIRSADVEEASFCVVAGRMGVDPYDPSQVPDELAAFVEEAISDPELPLARDLTEAAQPECVASQWSWVQRTRTRWKLGPMTGQAPVSTDIAERSPSGQGYRLAAIVRQRAGLSPSDPVPSVEAVAHTVAKVPFRTQKQNHVPGSGVRAAVGWNDKGDIIVAGPHPRRPSGLRFLAARGLYHALFACDRSERLVTDACTWDQQVSRAFAAELLAPQAALTARTGGRTDHSKVEELAREFGVSTIGVERQLVDAGVALIDDW
jgi:hypothetical protein